MNSLHYNVAVNDAWFGERRDVQAYPSGCRELDQQLPNGGFTRGWVYTCGASDLQLSLSLIRQPLAQLTVGDKWIVLLAPPRHIVQQLQQFPDVDRKRLLVVHTHSDFDMLWAAEQAMASHTCAAVIGWPERVQDVDLKRLKLAARTNRTMGFFFTHDHAAQSQTLKVMASRHGLVSETIDLAFPAENQLSLDLLVH